MGRHAAAESAFAHGWDLSSGAIELWTLDLETSSATVARLADVLARNELQRAHAFRFAHLRRNYVVARGALRVLLGRYLGLSPSGLTLAASLHGKPLIARGDSVSFNISHSGSVALLAFTRGCELGVDLETIRPFPDMLDVARRFFGQDECEELLALPPNEQQLAFFRGWTRKEAYLKAIGEGLNTPLNARRVTMGETAQFVHVDGDEHAGTDWNLHGIEHVPGFTGALAYRGAVRPLYLMPMITADEIVSL